MGRGPGRYKVMGIQQKKKKKEREKLEQIKWLSFTETKVEPSLEEPVEFA